MKKTLITLAAVAMAAVAQAATYSYNAETKEGTMTYAQADFSTLVNYTNVLDNGGGNHGWSRVLTFSGFELDYTEDFTMTAEIVVGDTGYNTWGSGVFATGADALNSSFANGFQTYVTVGGNVTGRVGAAEQGALLEGLSAGDILMVSVVYTTDEDTPGKLGTLALTYTSGTKTSVTKTLDVSTGANPLSSLSTTINAPKATGPDGQWGTADDVIFGPASSAEGTAWKINSVTVTGTQVVPEPATATLSLLALAGLAARRRRK